MATRSRIKPIITLTGESKGVNIRIPPGARLKSAMVFVSTTASGPVFAVLFLRNDISSGDIKDRALEIGLDRGWIQGDIDTDWFKRHELLWLGDQPVPEDLDSFVRAEFTNETGASVNGFLAVTFDLP